MIRFLLTTLLFLSDLPRLKPSLHSGYQPPSQPPGASGKAGDPSQLAYITLGLGVASWLLLPLFASAAGAILGWVELKNIKEGKSSKQGETITKIGFWLSVANMALAVLGTCAAMAIAVLVYGGMAAFFVAIGLSEAAAG
jgi:hypothetical protein